MIKLLVGWKDPEDPAAFAAHYDAVHAPLAARMPGLLEMTIARATTPSDPFVLLAELLFESEEALKQAMASPEGQAASADAPNLHGSAVAWTASCEDVVIRQSPRSVSAS